jgi:hypothetical protein
VLFALAWEWIGGESVHRLRQLNTRVAVLAGGAPHPERAVVGRHLLALSLDFGRGVLVTAAGIWLLGAVVPPLPALEVEPRGTPLVIAAVLAACFAGTVKGFGAGRWRLVLAGAAVAGGFLWIG